MEPKEKKVSIGLLWAIIAIPVFEILRVPLGVLFWLIGEAVKAALTPCMWFFERGVIGSFWSYQIPIVPYAVAIIFKVIAIPVVVIVLILALIIGLIILLLMMLLIWLDQIHILAWIIAPIFAYYAYMTDFWADQREDIRDRLLQIRAVLVNIVSWFASFRAIKIKLADGKTVRYKIKRKHSKAVLALALLFISIGIIGRSAEFLFTRNKNPTLVKEVKTLSGLKGEYFNLSQFYGKPSKFPENPDLSRIDKTISFNWERGRPDPAISPDYFGVRWTGFIYVPTRGIYKFKVWRDDGCRLCFDNKLIFDTWYEGDWDHWIDFEHHFEKTGWHSFKLEFYEIADRARITLKWQPPGKDSFEVIPSSHLGTATEEIDSAVITMNGREEKGIPTGIILKPEQSAKVSYISGKIISNTKTGFSVPIWGVPIEKTDSSWIPLMPYAKKGIWTNAVVVLLGPVGTEFVYPFQKDNYEIVVKNTTSKSQEIRLFFHDAPGYFQDNNGDVKFLVEKLPTVMARVSNVDDKAIMYINDQEVITTTWGSGPGGKSVGHRPGDSGWINITPYLKIGDNIFRLWVWNAAGCCSVSGTFEVQANDIATLTRSFKREDSSAGVKYDETVVLFFP